MIECREETKELLTEDHDSSVEVEEEHEEEIKEAPSKPKPKRKQVKLMPRRPALFWRWQAGRKSQHEE